MSYEDRSVLYGDRCERKSHGYLTRPREPIVLSEELTFGDNSQMLNKFWLANNIMLLKPFFTGCVKCARHAQHIPKSWITL